MKGKITLFCVFWAMVLFAPAAFCADQSESGQGVRLKTGDDSAALEFRTSGNLTPYLGVGLDLGDNSEEATEDSASEVPVDDASVAYRFEAGVECALNKRTRLGLDYRFSTESALDLGIPLLSESEETPDCHHISIGVEVDF